MTELSLSTFVNAEPDQFVKLMTSTPQDQLQALLASQDRGAFLDAIFDSVVGLFRPDRAGQTSAVIHWNITGRPDGGTDGYELVIANGTCTRSTSQQAEPSVSLTVGSSEFLKLMAGKANPMMLFMTGKLKAKGDLGLATKVGAYFDLPK